MKNGETDKKELRIDESQNLHKTDRRRKRDDFDIFDENPVPKIDKGFGGERKAKNNIIVDDEEEERDFSTNVDDKFKF